MDRLIVGRKLDSLRRCLARIENKRPPNVETLEHDIDVAVHAYDAINWQIVFAIATQGMRDLNRFAQVVAARASLA